MAKSKQGYRKTVDAKNAAKPHRGQRCNSSNRNKFHECSSANNLTKWRNLWIIWGICLFLTAAVWLVFGQTLHYDFVNFDDDLYVYANPVVRNGLNINGIFWAFSHIVAANWQPITIMSHMLDCTLYGLKAGGHHLTNILLHTVTTILLFLILRRTTISLWASASVAIIFAIHPLHVESVAWISERKDMLSGVFFMLTIWTYVTYVRNPTLWNYLVIVIIFSLGLLAKSMLVTLPFVLLLLDFWPLKRFHQSQAALERITRFPFVNILVTKRLILEKIPLLALTIIICVVTLYTQEEAIQHIPIIARIENALISFVTYIGQMFYPFGLAVYYPSQLNGPSLSEIIVGLVIFISITGATLIFQRNQPYLLVGWLWYVAMLVPVVGFIQVGNQAHADRYTYLPQIGLYLMIAYGLADFPIGWRSYDWLLRGLVAIVIAILIFCARIQTSYWKNSESLWSHTLAVTTNNYIAQYNYGLVLFNEERVDEAIPHFQETLQIKPDYAAAHNNLALALLQKGQVDEAIVHFKKVLEILPDNAGAHDDLGAALFQKGQVDEAIVHYKEALEINSNYDVAHYNLANALLQKGQVDEAIVHFKKALEINPNDADADDSLANALLQKGQVDEAIVYYKKSLGINPNSTVIQNHLGHVAWVLATSSNSSIRNGTNALDLALYIDELSDGKNPRIIAALAAAYAEIGRFPEAIVTAQRALKLALDQNNATLAAAIQSQINSYKVNSPLRYTDKLP